MRRDSLTESDLKVFEANLRKIKGTVGGGVDGHASTLGARGRLVTRREPVSSPAPPPYKSKLEACYAAHLDMLVIAGEIRRWEYEPMSLKLSLGKRYRPDFLVVLRLGAEAKPEMHEVKGKWTKNRRDSMTHLKWAAQRYGDVFTFRLIEWTGSGFSGSYVVI